MTAKKNHRLSVPVPTRVRSMSVLRSVSVNSAARRRRNAASPLYLSEGPCRRLSQPRILQDEPSLRRRLPAVSSKQAALIPASGNRNNSNGGLNNVGSNGYYWSASPNSATNGYNLNFNSTNVNPSNNNNRTNGFPVRCVRAFTPRGRKVFLWN